MRAIVAFILSFVVTMTVGTIVFPAGPPDPRTRPPSARPLKHPVPVTPGLDFLPQLPSLATPRTDDASTEYKDAWRLLKAGYYRGAERVYLDILDRRPQDPKAMQALVTLQRILASEDPKKLREQAQAYRQASGTRRVAEETYGPREMTLLADASLSALNEITAEQRLSAGARSRTSVDPTLFPVSPQRGHLTHDPVRAIREWVHRAAFGERPRPLLRKERTTAVAMSGTPHRVTRPLSSSTRQQRPDVPQGLLSGTDSTFAGTGNRPATPDRTTKEIRTSGMDDAGTGRASAGSERADSSSAGAAGGASRSGSADRGSSTGEGPAGSSGSGGGGPGKSGGSRGDDGKSNKDKSGGGDGKGSKEKEGGRGGDGKGSKEKEGGRGGDD